MQQVDATPWKFSGDLQQERDPEEDAEITVAGLKLIGLFAGSVPPSSLYWLFFENDMIYGFMIIEMQSKA